MTKREKQGLKNCMIAYATAFATAVVIFILAA